MVQEWYEWSRQAETMAARYVKLDVLPRERPDPETAEVKRWPVTVQRVIDAIRECYPTVQWTDAAIVAAYNTERKARKNADWERLHTMPCTQLEKHLSSVMRTIRSYENRAQPQKLAECASITRAKPGSRGTLVRYQRDARTAT